MSPAPSDEATSPLHKGVPSSSPPHDDTISNNEQANASHPEPGSREQILSRMKDLATKEAALKHLQSETKELKSLVDQLLNDHCKALCHSLTTMMYEKLPRELRLMIYDYFINEMLSEIGLSRTSAVYYRSDNFWKAIWREPRGYIWRASWVGHKVANEAVGYAYSQITFNMNFPEQINNFLLKPHDVFGREVDPKHYIRKLEFYIYYNKQVGIDGYRATGAKTIHDDEGIKKLRETQVTTLEELLKVAQPKGFKLLLLVRASHGSASTYTQAVETLKGLGPTIYKLKGAGFEVSILQRYQSGWANEDLFAGWLDGSFEDWETRIDERLLQLQNEGIVSG